MWEERQLLALFSAVKSTTLFKTVIHINGNYSSHSLNKNSTLDRKMPTKLLKFTLCVRSMWKKSLKLNSKWSKIKEQIVSWRK